MRHKGKLATAVATALLATPGAALAASSVDPAVQSYLRFPGSDGDAAVGAPAGDLNGDGQADLLVSQTFQVTLGDFATNSTIYYGRLPRGGEADSTPGVHR